MALNFAGAASPGPDFFLITRLATKSRRHALAAVLGIQIGVLMWVSLTVFGAAAVLTTFPQLLGIVKLIGGGFLLWTGYSMVRGGWAMRVAPPVTVAAAQATLGRMRHSFKLGLGTNLANPKIVLFLAALVAPRIPPDLTWWWAIIVILALAWTALALHLFLAIVVSTRRIQRAMLAAGPWIDIVTGIFFIIAGAALVYEGAGDVLGMLGQ